ncbi:hypothetical protein ACQP3D_25770, partial [Escherichia coli]
EGRRERAREKRTEKKKTTEGWEVGRALFKRNSSEYTQVVLSVAAAEGLSCQNPKDRPVEMPEH